VPALPCVDDGPRTNQKRTEDEPGSDRERTTESGPKTGQNGLRGGYPRLMNSSFSGFIHFWTNRSSAGWALLCRMVKHTSKEFLCGREHVRVFECREIRSKTGTKNDEKQVRANTPNPKNTDIPANRLSNGGSKWSSKMPLIDRQINGQKYVQNRIRNDGHQIAFQ
jgi:hypothetical protein